MMREEALSGWYQTREATKRVKGNANDEQAGFYWVNTHAGGGLFVSR